MSVRIGIILSKDYKSKPLESFKKKYDLSLMKVDNNYVNKQLLDDEIFLQATETGCDSLTGIGAYDLYNMEVSLIYKNIHDALLAQSVADEFVERKYKYKEDALRWIKIIEVLKYEYKINKVALFWHFCSTSFNQEKINFSSRENCDIKNITMEYVMKIKQDVIVFFE